MNPLFINSTAGNSLDSISLTMIEPLTHNSTDAQDTLETETSRKKKKHGKGKEKVINF